MSLATLINDLRSKGLTEKDINHLANVSLPKGAAHWRADVAKLVALRNPSARPAAPAAPKPAAPSGKTKTPGLTPPGTTFPIVPVDAGGGAAKPAEDEFDAASAAAIKNMLNQYGLDELIPQVDGWVRAGLSWPEIEVQLRDPSSVPGKVFDRIYPEIRLRNEKGLQPMSVQQIQTYRTQRAQLLREAGAPPGFYDSPEDATKDIVGDVSLQELKQRADEYASFGMDLIAADPQKAAELEAFERYYSVKVSPIAVAGLALDQQVTLPALKRMTQSVRMDVSAGRAGFGDLNRSEAERLSDIGVTEDQAVQGFGTLAGSKELVNALPGMENAEDAISRADQLGAVFEGNAQARQRIERRQRQRVGAFEGGGSFSSDQSGFSGLGTAR